MSDRRKMVTLPMSALPLKAYVLNKMLIILKIRGRITRMITAAESISYNELISPENLI